jgi:murein DD-endopeptidase MepM/ murein hydrolase activator NlpD
LQYQVPEGTPVLATADGKLYKAVTDLVNGAGYDYYFNSYIDHQNGWYSWYLYAPLTPAILAEINLNGYARVTKGQIIGNTTGDRLHFEVRCNGSDDQHVVDPYKLGLWLPKSGHIEPLLLLLIDPAPAIGY